MVPFTHLGHLCKMTTRQLSLVLLLLLGSIQVYAQRQGFHIGLKGGANISSADGDHYRSLHKVGLQGGVFLFYNFKPNLGIQVEPMYSSARINVHRNYDREDPMIGNGTKKLTYFSVPILFKVDLGNFMSLLAGPEFNTLKNDDRYTLNDGRQAFKSSTQLSYSLGIDMGMLYFKYRGGLKGFSNLPNDGHARIGQYQLGIRWKII